MTNKQPYTGPGYSEEPGQHPRNKTGESANRWFPKASDMYPGGRVRNPDSRLAGGPF